MIQQRGQIAAIAKRTVELNELDCGDEDRSDQRPLITLFAIPKPFQGQIGTIQRNALRSWSLLRPDVEIVLFGNVPELAGEAARVGASYYPIRENEQGTPILSDAFAAAHRVGKGQLIAYLNSDIVIGGDFVTSAMRLKRANLESFLAIGQRIDLSVQEEFGPDTGAEVGQLFGQIARDGRPSSIVCKDYFLFTTDLFQKIPDFVVGRGNWDNWIVRQAKSLGVPVVDIARVTTVVHQSHDYHHVRGGRFSTYISGPEARMNQKLGGGRHLISGSTANWVLEPERLVRRKAPRWAMVRDLPRFLTLLRNLLFLRYFFLFSTLQILS